MWNLYILECKDTSLYTGVTDNVELRFKRHRSGDGGYYTSNNKPIRILYREEFKTLSEVKIREQQIKRWSRAKKLALIKGSREELINLSKSRD
jgi:putative endonuclease